MQPLGGVQKPVVGQNSEGLIEWYKRILELNPRNIRTRCKLGWLLQRLGRHEEALAQWQEMLKIDANNLVAREAILQLGHQVKREVAGDETVRQRKKQF
jgi:predicted TPR repeat methyltransferase